MDGEVIHLRGEREALARLQMLLGLVSAVVGAWVSWGDAWIGRGFGWALIVAAFPLWLFGMMMAVGGLATDGKPRRPRWWLRAVLGMLLVIASCGGAGVGVASL